VTDYLDRETVELIAVEAIGIQFIVRDEGLLASALARPSSGFGGQEVYPDLWQKAAALLESLSRNHALVDGNKRTALVATVAFLEINGIDCRSASDDACEAFILKVATGGYDGDVPKTAAQLRQIMGH